MEESQADHQPIWDGNFLKFAPMGQNPTLEHAWERVDCYRQRWLVEIVQSQMTKTKVFTGRGSGDHVPDLHFLVGDDHPVNYQLDQLPFLFKRGQSLRLAGPAGKTPQ
jgi:hypothetical protein